MLKEKQQIANDFKRSEFDTGSIELQIVLLTDRINELQGHFKVHAKDYNSRRGLLLLVGRRRRFLRYVEKHNQEVYKKLLESLNLRK